MLINPRAAESMLRMFVPRFDRRILELEKLLAAQGVSPHAHRVRETLQAGYHYPLFYGLWLRFPGLRERTIDKFNTDFKIFLHARKPLPLEECEYIFLLACNQRILPVSTAQRESLAEMLAYQCAAEHTEPGLEDSIDCACAAIIEYCGGTAAAAIAAEISARYLAKEFAEKKATS